MAIAITYENFESLVLSGDKPALVDFWAEWCGPCRRLGPMVEELAAEHPEIMVGKVNVDQYPDLARRYGVAVIPTVIAFRDGEPVAQMQGVQSKEDLLSMVL